jgi:HAMP domain-containing protein
MIIYFLLIGFAALLLGVEFTHETFCYTSSTPHQMEDSTSKQTTTNPDSTRMIEHLRHKAVLMILIIMSVVVIVLTMFIKNITGPLQLMIEKSRQISRGDLSQTIEIEARNELADLGGVINEMSSNLQEIIHYSLNTCLSGQHLLQKVQMLLKEQPTPERDEKIRLSLKELENELDACREIIDCFKFYSINEKLHG